MDICDSHLVNVVEFAKHVHIMLSTIYSVHTYVCKIFFKEIEHGYI